MLVVVADESHDEKQQRVMAFGGLLGAPGELDRLADEWQTVLLNYGVDVFHAADCDSAQGAFTGWSREKIESLQRRLISLIAAPEYELRGFAVGFPIEPYEKLRPALKPYLHLFDGPINGPLDAPWFIGLLSIVTIVGDERVRSLVDIPDGERIAFVFDRHRLAERGKVIYQALAASPNKILQPGGIVFEDKAKARILQAADLLAYEYFRYFHDTQLSGAPERWQLGGLRRAMVAHRWIDPDGLQKIVSHTQQEMAGMFPNPVLPPGFTKKPKRIFRRPWWRRIGDTITRVRRKLRRLWRRP